jgi:hypothetical protein
MSVLSWLKPATIAVIVVAAAGSLLAPAPAQAQVTVLRGSPSQPYFSVPDNTSDDQSSNYSPSGYGDDYPYYGDDFPLDVGVFDRGFRRGDLTHRGFRAGFHGGGFHGGSFHGGGFHGGGFHGGGFGGGGFHGGGGHR